MYKRQRYDNGIKAVYKMVDTCAAEFAASTPYYYSVFGGECEAKETTGRKKVLVLGSGPIRIEYLSGASIITMRSIAFCFDCAMDVLVGLPLKRVTIRCKRSISFCLSLIHISSCTYPTCYTSYFFKDMSIRCSQS